ncbi:MAG TPA: MraY family glycosyltransferase [Aggregatilineales bacterium]|nr:undecaprenyl/decaprenyl-phosphate alpha-N-acetylglucosaminyl 1-phosphate transferase [Anaerolineales bacterium]HRE47291.1 MraY family glycosyltransferase [Aggregatilineales bacterium]
MPDYMPIFAVGIAASVGLTPLTRRLALRIGMVDKPNARKVHRKPIPLMGGLAIYLAFLITLVVFIPLPKHLMELGAILLGATFLAVVGFWDDRYELKPSQKYLASAVAAFGVMAAGIRVDLFGIWFLDIPLTLLWFVGIINAVNLMDNMDGLAAGVSAIAAFFLFILASSQGQELVSTLSAALCGALLGFLVYNFNPARTFMGDMGALVIGFLLAVLGIKLRFQTQVTLASWMIPVLVLGMPIFDTTLVTFTRLREGRSPAQGGKDHTSHRLVAMGLHPRVAVITIYVAGALLGCGALIISQVPLEPALIVGAGIVIAAGGCFLILEYVRVQQRRKEFAAQHHEKGGV